MARRAWRSGVAARAWRRICTTAGERSSSRRARSGSWGTRRGRRRRPRCRGCGRRIPGSSGAGRDGPGESPAEKKSDGLRLRGRCMRLTAAEKVEVIPIPRVERRAVDPELRQRTAHREIRAFHESIAPPCGTSAPLSPGDRVIVAWREREPPGAHARLADYAWFSAGRGFMTARTAPVGSCSTPKRPTPEMSSGPNWIVAPSFLALAIVASGSSTKT